MKGEHIYQKGQHKSNDYLLENGDVVTIEYLDAYFVDTVSRICRDGRMLWHMTMGRSKLPEEYKSWIEFRPESNGMPYHVKPCFEKVRRLPDETAEIAGESL